MVHDGSHHIHMQGVIKRKGDMVYLLGESKRLLVSLLQPFCLHSIDLPGTKDAGKECLLTIQIFQITKEEGEDGCRGSNQWSGLDIPGDFIWKLPLFMLYSP